MLLPLAFRWRKHVNIILIGAQGSGKGTQAERLSENLGILHIASGDMFRKAIEKKTMLGLKAKVYIDRGELVPDDITVAMVLNSLQEAHDKPGVLLDGFPRTIAQAQALDDGLKDTDLSIDLAIYLNVPRDVLLRRLSGRFICRANQHVYNIETHPPKVPGKCDLDGSDLYQRPDDRGPAVQKRLDIFFHETIYLLDYYEKQEKLIEINGNQDIEQVQDDLLTVIKSREISRAEKE
jgi:adenylate kinase